MIDLDHTAISMSIPEGDFFSSLLMFTPPWQWNDNDKPPWEYEPRVHYPRRVCGGPNDDDEEEETPDKSQRCRDQCLPYLGSGEEPFPPGQAWKSNGKPYLDKNGKIWWNDNGGSWAFQRCMFECMSSN